MTNGGFATTILVTLLGGIFPMIGNWYPDKYENSEDFNEDLGRIALFEWIGLLIPIILSMFGFFEEEYLKAISQIGKVIILYRIFLIYPFESFGGMRIFKWNKLLYLAMSIISFSLVWYN